LLCAGLRPQNDFAVGVSPLEFVESVSDLVDRKGGGNVTIAGAGSDQVSDFGEHLRCGRIGAGLGLRADLAGLLNRDGAMAPLLVKTRLRAGSQSPVYPGNGSDDVLHTSAPDPPNLSRRADVGDGIAVDQYEVGPSAGFDRAPVVQPEVFGWQHCRRAQHLDGRKARFDEQFELVVQAFAVAG
jgi:hypothetical protein